MARINRTDVIQKAVNDLALNVSVDKIPNEILDKVQLVYGLNRHFSNFVGGNSSTSTGSNSFTLPSVSAGGEIYITALQVALAKDATCDQATGTVSLTATLDSTGLSTNLIQIPIITLTAQSEDITLSLPYPLKLKPGTNITFTASYTAGLMSRAYKVYGFTTSSN